MAARRSGGQRRPAEYSARAGGPPRGCARPAAARGGFPRVLNSSTRAAPRAAAKRYPKEALPGPSPSLGKGGCRVSPSHTPPPAIQPTGVETDDWAGDGPMGSSRPVAGDPAPSRTRPTRGRSCLLWPARPAGLTASPPQAPRWKKPQSSGLGARPLPPATAGVRQARWEGSPRPGRTPASAMRPSQLSLLYLPLPGPAQEPVGSLKSDHGPRSPTSQAEICER